MGVESRIKAARRQAKQFVKDGVKPDYFKLVFAGVGPLTRRQLRRIRRLLELEPAYDPAKEGGQ